MFKRFWCFINCKINKILSLLAIMIFVFGISCASARVLTDIEIKNFILNGYKTKISSNVPTNIQNNVLNANFSTWINLMQTNEGHYGLQLSANGQQVSLHIISGSASNIETYYPYSNGTSFLVNTNYIRTDYYTYEFTTNRFFGITNESGWYFSNPRIWWYTDTNIKTNASNQTKNGTNLYTAPYSDPQNAFEENWLSSIKWELIPNSNNRITIPNMPYNYYTLNKGTFTTSFATLQDSSYTNNILMSIYAYNGNSWQNVNTQYLFDEAKELISNKFPSTTNGDIMSSLIQVNSNIIPANCIISLTASPNSVIAQDLGLTEISQYFYITDSNTVITSNSLDIIATFSGDTDYSNEVQQAIDNNQNDINNNNIQDIVNDLTNDNEINGMVSDYFPSGENSSIAFNMGFFNFYNPFLDFFDTIGYGIKNVLFGTRKCHFRYKSSWYY